MRNSSYEMNLYTIEILQQWYGKEVLLRTLVLMFRFRVMLVKGWLYCYGTYLQWRPLGKRKEIRISMLLHIFCIWKGWLAHVWDVKRWDEVHWLCWMLFPSFLYFIVFRSWNNFCSLNLYWTLRSADQKILIASLKTLLERITIISFNFSWYPEFQLLTETFLPFFFAYSFFLPQETLCSSPCCLDKHKDAFLSRLIEWTQLIQESIRKLRKKINN